LCSMKNAVQHHDSRMLGENMHCPKSKAVFPSSHFNLGLVAVASLPNWKFLPLYVSMMLLVWLRSMLISCMHSKSSTPHLALTCIDSLQSVYYYLVASTIKFPNIPLLQPSMNSIGSQPTSLIMLWGRIASQRLYVLHLPHIIGRHRRRRLSRKVPKVCACQKWRNYHRSAGVWHNMLMQ